MSLEESLFQELVDALNANRLVLPTLPEVALRVREVVENENATADQIAREIAKDPAVSARLIRVVNSPLYRGRAPIDDLRQAVARLGNRNVRSLVTGLVMQQMFQATSEGLDARLRTLWEHSTQVAAISRSMAVGIPGIKAEEALLAGLLHDIGTLPILVRVDEHPELLTDEVALDRLISRLHCQIGAAILHAWEFPAEMVQVAGEHEHLDRDPPSPPDYVDLVMVANLQAYLGTAHALARVDWSTVPAFRRLGIPTDVSAIDLGTLREQGEELKAALG